MPRALLAALQALLGGDVAAMRALTWSSVELPEPEPKLIPFRCPAAESLVEVKVIGCADVAMKSAIRQAQASLDG